MFGSVIIYCRPVVAISVEAVCRTTVFYAWCRITV